MKFFFRVIERWTLPTLISVSLILFFLTVGEKMGAGLAANPVEAGVQALTLDSAETGFTLYMNFVINLTFLWAALKVIMASVGLKLDNLLVKKFSSSHILIVSGFSWRSEICDTDGFSNLGLALDLAISASKKNNVVIVLPQLEEDQRSVLWEKGVKVVTHQGAPTEILKAAGISRADVIFAVCDDPFDNITLCRAALSPATENQDLQARCLIEPLSLKQSIASEEYFEERSLNRLRLLNQSELFARKVLSEFPPDLSMANAEQRVHVLLFGMTSITEAMILQLARIGHYKNNQRPKLTIIGVDDESRLLKLNNHYPSLPQWLEVVHEDFNEGEISAVALSKLLDDRDAPIAGYITGLDEIGNLRITKMLLSALRMVSERGNFDNFQVIAIDPPGGTVLSDFFMYGEYENNAGVFSLSGKYGENANSVIAGNLLSDLDDRVSKEIHEAYRKKDLDELKRNPAHKLHPNSLEWSALPETIRDANRAVADHLEVKLRAISYQLTNSKEVVDVELMQDEIEILAIMEHRRWWADRSLSGWKFSEVRDDIKRHHPNMVPYESMSEADKQKDRDSVLKIIDIAKQGGMKLTRMNKIT